MNEMKKKLIQLRLRMAGQSEITMWLIRHEIDQPQQYLRNRWYRYRKRTTLYDVIKSKL